MCASGVRRLHLQQTGFRLARQAQLGAALPDHLR
jgi:hypothetical protein